jgi:hypothetical protein
MLFVFVLLFVYFDRIHNCFPHLIVHDDECCDPDKREGPSIGKLCKFFRLLTMIQIILIIVIILWVSALLTTLALKKSGRKDHCVAEMFSA